MKLKLINVTWREYFDEDAVKQLTEMKTLPRYETAVEVYDPDDAEEVAEAIAAQCNKDDSESFVNGGDILILEPASLAGRYLVHTDWDPSFSAMPYPDDRTKSQSENQEG